MCYFNLGSLMKKNGSRNEILPFPHTIDKNRKSLKLINQKKEIYSYLPEINMSQIPSLSF